MLWDRLRDLRTEVTADLALIKQRLTSLESQVAGVHADMALLHGRIDRIEHRMDLREEAG
jgi:hypothetical protein